MIIYFAWIIVWKWKILNNSLNINLLKLSKIEDNEVMFFYWQQTNKQIDWKYIHDLITQNMEVVWFDISLSKYESNIWINYNLINKLQIKEEYIKYYLINIESMHWINDTSLVNSLIKEKNILCIRPWEISRFLWNKENLKIDSISF